MQKQNPDARPKLKTKTIQVIGKQNTQSLIDVLRKSNQDYVITSSSYSDKITLPNEKLHYFCTPDYTALSAFGTLSSIKSYLKKSGKAESLPELNPMEIEYFNFKQALYFKKSDKKIKTFENVREFDISAAYVNSFFNLGLITKDHYSKLINGPKPNRLKILGALATQKTVEYWQGGTLIDSFPVSNPQFRNCWFHAVQNVDTCINQIFNSLGDDALFYFVDNLYVKDSPGLERRMKQEFSKHNFQIKSVPLEAFFCYNAKKGAVCVVKREAEIKPKYFFIPNQKIKYWTITK